MIHALSMWCVALALLPLGAADQGRPDFSGTWTMDEARSGSATYDSFEGPVTWTVTQTTDRLVIDILRGQRSVTLTFTLSDTRPAAPLGMPAFRAYWDEDRLVTETAQNVNDQTVTTKETRTLVAGGREMIVERTVTVEHGYTLRGARSSNTARDVFVRAVH